MKKLLLILLCLPFIGFGQGWKKTFQSADLGFSVKQTSDNGYIICGTTNYNNNNSDIFLLKTDINGNQEWSKTFGGMNQEEGYSAEQTLDGGYIILGETNSYGNGDDDFYLIKTDASGNEQWTKTFGQGYYDWGRSVKQTTDGGYILCGTLQPLYNNVNAAIYLIKTDSNGNEIWSNTFGTSSYGYYVEQTNDGGYIVCGDDDVNEKIVLIKTNLFGTEIWSKTLGNMFPGTESSLKQTIDGGYIVCGDTETNNGNNEAFTLIKTDANGNEQWLKTFFEGYSYGQSVDLTIDGGFVAVGWGLNNNAGDISTFIVKTDINGTLQWSKIINSSIGFSVQQTNDGGYIVVGKDLINPMDMYQGFLLLVKLDSNGNTTNSISIPITHKRKIQKTVNILGKEIQPKKNTPLLYLYDDGTVEKRITID